MGRFFAGLVIGLSACVLLLLSVVGTALASVKSTRQYVGISAGLVAGILVAYVILAVLFIWLVSFVQQIILFKYIFGVILLVIGIWQIVDFKREKSVIFGTPGRVKTTLKNFIEMQTPWAAFLVGIIFAFIKVPCFGGPFLAVIFEVRDNPALFSYIALYYVGMLLPIILVLVGMGVGLKSDKVNQFRLKYRPHLRLLSGIVLIIVTIYLLLV